MDWSDYAAAVVNNYRDMRKDGKLPLNLSFKTPAKIRDQVLLFICDNPSMQDQKVIAYFAKGDIKGLNYKELKSRIDVDRFKPLILFLNGRSASTSPQNIELLACLIGYKDRPFRFDKENINDGLNPKAYTEPAIQHAPKIADSGITRVGKDYFYRKTIKISSFIIGLMLLVLTLSWAYSKYISASAPQGCMIWSVDQFRKTACNIQGTEALVLPLDELRFRDFKKITNTDTFSSNSIGKVYYSKINGQLEFFTSKGNGYHPVHTERVLKPLTAYIMNKYLGHHEN